MNKIFKIITHPNKILRKQSTDINTDIIESKNFQIFITAMIQTMIKKDGVGLAAPQIGKNIRVFIVNMKDGPEAFINPQIIKKSWRKEDGEEGCLSVPNVFGLVKRHKTITCQYINRKNEHKIIEANGLMARIIQHENDHLSGILFIDNAKKIQKIKK